MSRRLIEIVSSGPGGSSKRVEKGVLDELVIEGVLHFEQMDRGEWWMRVADASISITRDADGLRVDILRGVYEPVPEGGRR